MTAQDIVKSFAFISLERAELLIKYNDLVMEKNKVMNLTCLLYTSDAADD